MVRQVRRLVALLVMVLMALPASATVYKYIDANGNMVLTDQPVQGAEEVNVRPTMTIPAVKGDLGPLQTAASGKRVAYVITIASPLSNAIFSRNTDDVVPVAVSVAPNLRDGAVLQLELDGAPFDNSEISLDNLTRGSHTITSAVLDSKGHNLVDGPSVTFFVQQHSSQATGSGSSSATPSTPK